MTRVGCASATHPAARGHGLGSRLLRRAIDDHSGLLIDIDAQTYLAGWYEMFGFEIAGVEFLDVGIPHVAMTRLPR